LLCCFEENLLEEGWIFNLKKKGEREAKRQSKSEKGIKDTFITFGDDIKLSGIVIALEDLK
jgi:hypothetical protein